MYLWIYDDKASSSTVFPLQYNATNLYHVISKCLNQSRLTRNTKYWHWRPYSHVTSSNSKYNLNNQQLALGENGTTPLKIKALWWKRILFLRLKNGAHSVFQTKDQDSSDVHKGCGKMRKSSVRCKNSQSFAILVKLQELEFTWIDDFGSLCFKAKSFSNS